MVRMPKKAVALLLSSHPGPAAVVTIVALLLGVVVGATASVVVLLTAAVLAGQLSIGWSNDWLDAQRDRALGRSDKPVARGSISAAAVRACALGAFGAMIVLSALLGPAAAIANIVTVCSGWAYNLGLKATVLSPLPYAVAFGLLPAVATLSLRPPAIPAWWVILAGALLGVAAHLTNALPDLAGDAATGIRGVPHRLGADVCGYVAFSLLGAVAVLLAVGTLSAGDASPAFALLPVVGACCGIALTIVGLRLTARGVHTRTLMRLVMAGAVIDVVMLLGAGPALLA
jgi:4-hydroxybenzoate polyprenyltransferase and related prenyltransferases